MRSVGLCGLLLAALGTTAFAADMPVLRGSQGLMPSEPVYFRWEGVYIGGQGGYASGGFDFGKAGSPLVGSILRNSVLEAPVSSWEILGKGSAPGASYGGFIGYNFQWDDAVLGIEANYSRTSLSVSSGGGLARSIINPTGSNPPSGHTYTYNVTAGATASATVTDIATFRGRGAWAAGPWMPYAFVGVAVGRADISRSASISGTRYDDYTVDTTLPGGTVVQTPVRDVYTLSPGSQGESKPGQFIYGWTAGLGVDVALTQNVFLRAEWEWVQFNSVAGIDINISTARGAIGAKF
ncbi:outer membrane protein [Rhodoplanes elegans]|nr:outer membrane beta-barrel protein [Rhodoplanes elegans]